MIIPVFVTVSQATLASGSSFKWASRMASEIWSHILSEKKVVDNKYDNAAASDKFFHQIVKDHK